MALANKFGWLVLSTGNKTELWVLHNVWRYDCITVIADLSKMMFMPYPNGLINIIKTVFL